MKRWQNFSIFSSAYRIFHNLATCLDAKDGCNGGEYGDDYFEDFTPNSFVFVFHGGFQVLETHLRVFRGTLTFF